MARLRWTILALAIAAGALAGEALAAPRAADAQGPQWPNVPLPAPEADTPRYAHESFEARWPSIPDDTVGSIPARQPSPAAWLAPGDANPFEPRVPSAFTGEMGLRYWFSWAKTGKNLYDTSGSSMVSRLTYDGMYGSSVEGFGRLDHTSGFYTKALIGGGLFFNGGLNDEDFPPVTSPYSSTLSKQRGSGLWYANADFGFNVWRDPAWRLGAFVGYSYFGERVNAYGCRQIASNSSICGTSPVSDSILVITQDNSWHSLRVGADLDLKLSETLTLRADAAYLPYVYLSGTDLHHLRIGTTAGSFTGGIPEDGTGHGWQLEAAVSYAVNENVNIALGGRYWHLESSGNTHFEGHVVGTASSPQPVDWKSDIYGVFVQGSFKFGPYAPGIF